VAGVVVHVRPAAESLIHRSVPPLEPHGSRAKAPYGTGGGRPLLQAASHGDATPSPLFFVPAPSVTTDIHQLRQRLRARRRGLSVAEQRRAALVVASRLMEWPVVAGAPRIAGYWACEGELDPAPLLEQVWAMGKPVYLPVLADTPPRSLQFAPFRPGAPMRRNRFDIPEPEASPAEWLHPSELDLVLAPLVAFDPAGTRLGMGGGFYDRSFAFLRDPDYCGHRPRLLGLGYDFQQVAELIRQPWDIPLDAAATESALYVFSGMVGGEA
jgi:5-formyltetrahydrofolate cyclo-ligase